MTALNIIELSIALFTVAIAWLHIPKYRMSPVWLTIVSLAAAQSTGTALTALAPSLVGGDIDCEMSSGGSSREPVL